MRRAPRGPDAHRGGPVPAGGGRGAGGGDAARSAGPGGAGRGPAAARSGGNGAGRGGPRAAAAGGRRDGGRGTGGPVRGRSAARGGRARRRAAQAPGRGGGGMSATVATVGTFDGIHRGHQAVLDDLVRRARASGLVSLLVTFDPHPLEVVNPSAAPRLLTLSDEKRLLAAALGVERIEVLAFTPELARLGPEEFVRDVLRARFGMQELVLGYDHGFGRGRAGDVEMVRRLAREDGFAMEVVAAVKDDGQPISSSLIRTAVAHGDLASAERGLGRPYSLRAVVDRGAGRGRTIGVPTINLTSPDPRKLLPPDGVYAVRVEIGGKRYDGMMNQGPRPTFGVHARGLEIHLFDFTGDVYGATVTVAWARRLRDTQTFPSRQALVDQIERDEIAARAVLKG